MEIPIEDRKEVSSLIVDVLAVAVATMNPEDRVRHIYNRAIDDVVEAIDNYIKYNPQYVIVLRSLRENIANWMPLVS